MRGGRSQAHAPMPYTLHMQLLIRRIPPTNHLSLPSPWGLPFDSMQLLSLEVWGGLVGMFELNNLALAVPSPVEDFFLAVGVLSFAWAWHEE